MLTGCTILCCLHHRVPLRRPGYASFARWGDFLRLGLPGMMMMGEWWAAEIGILITGLLDDPTTNLASMAIYQMCNGLCFMLPLGASVACATRVGTALGAGNAVAARRSASVGVVLALGYGLGAALLLFLLRNRIALIFTSNPAVISKLSELLPVLMVYVVCDAGMVACSGTLQGCGRQRHGMVVVIVSYYMVGLPVGATLAFRCE